MLKKMTKRTFYCLILFLILVGIGVYLFVTDIDRRSINLTLNNVKIALDNEDWTTENVTLTVNYSKSIGHIKEYSFDNGKTWTKNNTLVVDHNQKLDIIVKDINNKTLKIDYEVKNIDREGPIVLFNDNIEVSQNSIVDLKQLVTAYDEGSGLRDDVVITPQAINTRNLGSYKFWVYTIDNLANRTIKEMTINVVEKASVVMAQSLSINYHNMTLEIGDTAVIVPTILPKNTTNKRVAYISSNPEVAEVDAGGNVTAKQVGSTTITVITVNGLKDICVVMVK